MNRDLMYATEVKTLVRDAYRNLPAVTAVVARKHYSPEDLAGVPQIAVDRALGVADHLRYAEVRPGDTVLNIGCGGGIDTILAARRRGPTGRVVALDFLPEMLQHTTAASRAAGLDNVETLEAEMEAIPLPDHSVDLVISNGVINLSARKARVLTECPRVLRPAGRLCVSDLTVDQDEHPPEVVTQPAAWAGCIAGALAESEFLHKLARAGFTDIEVVHREPLGIDDCALYPLFSPEVIDLMRRLIPTDRHGRVAVAIVVRARAPSKPAAR